MDYLLIALALLFTTGSQLLQKLGAVKAAGGTAGKPLLVKALALTEIRWAIILLVIGTALWFAVLYRMEISKAFPFLSLGFVLVMLLSRYYLREVVSPSRWAGAVLIAIGVVMVSLT